MDVYKITNQADGFAIIDFGDINMSEVLRAGSIEQLEGKSFKWNKDGQDKKISDCPFYIGALPIFETIKVKSILGKLGVKMASFTVEGINYTAISAPLLKGSVINRERSKMRTFKSGKIMNVDTYVFNSGIQYPSAFRIEEFNLFTFLDAEACKVLSSCGLKELKVTPCAID